MQTVYEMKDDVWGYLVVKLVFEIDFEKIEICDVEKPIFLRGGIIIPPSVLKGLKDGFLPILDPEFEGFLITNSTSTSLN